MVKKIQVALQGGGAKIVGLVAALQALDELCKSGEIEITRIAGTSAGAIAGVLYAAGVTPDQMRTGLGKAITDGMIRYPLPDEKSGGRVRRAFRVSRLLWAVWRNRPLADDGPLRTVITQLLTNALGGGTAHELATLRIPMIVVASNLSTRKAMVYSTEETPTTPLLDATLDSSGLPFVFRTAGGPHRGVLMVDGGLSANLPADFLMPHSANDGDVVAISFSEPTTLSAPSSAAQLAGAILDTAINASTYRQKTSGQVQVINLDVGSIGTLDFVAAQRELARPDDGSAGPVYNAAYHDAKQKLETILKAAGGRGSGRTLTKQIWNEVPEDSLRQHYRIYSSQQSRNKYLVKETGFAAEAHCLTESADDEDRADLVRSWQVFRPLEGCPLDVVMMAVGVQRADMTGLGICKVTDQEGKDVPFEPVPVRVVQAGHVGGILGVALYFTPPLVSPKEAGHFFTAVVELRMRGEEAFPKLKKHEPDDLNFSVVQDRFEGPIKVAKMILDVPEAFGAVDAIPRPHGGAAASSTDDNYARLKTIMPGPDGMAPKGFRRYVWEATDVTYGQTLWVDLYYKASTRV